MKIINGNKLKELLISGSNNLNNKYREIDALNVFPVPDGDTGTNMSLTFTNGVSDALKSNSDSISEVSKKLSKGLLMGARGNSGVILSQIFRGVAGGLEKYDEADSNILADAFENGTKIAYKAVMKPVEGTILTVIRESSWYAKKYVEIHPDITVNHYFEKLIGYAKESLDNTPELLPVLKEVGVVDSGGAGLLVILEGMKSALDGNPIEKLDNIEEVTSQVANHDHDEFGYCTEFLIKLQEDKIQEFKEERLRESLGKIGNSIVVVQDEEIVKVHVHTLIPGDALNIGQRYGEFIKLKIENMQEQNEHLNEEHAANKTKELSKFAIITVAAGDGLVETFKEYRADIVISGGQTMNPSTEDFISAIKKANAENIFILPNNSNIILAAKQAKDIMEDVNIEVIETKSIAQGLAACMMYNPEDTLENNISEMIDAKDRVTTAQLTYAIKDTVFEGLEIKNGDYMGIIEKDIVSANQMKKEVIIELLNKLIKDSDYEIITIIAGEDATDDDLELVVNYIKENSDLEIEICKGNQPVYSFIFGVE